MRQNRLQGNRVPEYLSTHPLTQNRVSDTRNRAEQYPRRDVADAQEYHLVRSRLQVRYAKSADIAVETFKDYLNTKGRQYLIDNVITRCPTNALSINDDDTLAVDNRNCVRCMHCLNVMPKALSPGDDRGATICIGGKRTLKIGDLMGTVIVPFKKLETEEDFESLVERAEEVIDFWAENGLEHERCGEMIERIGLVNFLEGIGVDVDPNMVNNPRQSSYVRMDEWDAEAEKWFERKAEEAAG